jgi:hypothetical protein
MIQMAQSESSSLWKIIYISMGILILTVIHHVYGAILYNTPERLHIAYFVLPVILLYSFLFLIYRRRPAARHGRIAFWSLIIITVLVPVGTFGIIEGGYNHLLKNILYFGGADVSLFDRLYSSPLYELPNDILFEVSGILQFFIGLYAGWNLVLLGRNEGREKK